MKADGTLPLRSLAELYAPVAAELTACQTVLRDELISDQPFISDLCRHVDHFHGKLMRPALLLLAARACGEVRPAHHVLGAVVELVHIATLVHDDVLDEADIRRRAATVNRLWGNHRAVLLGDFLYSHAFHLCSGLESQFASRLIGQTAITVCEGEMMQVANRQNLELTEAEYIDIITRKTASLIEACCHLGAHFAGADPRTISRLRSYGHSVGIAFQIADDLLDLTGSECEVGKSLGRDLCTEEVTLPLIHYLRTGTPAQRTRMLAAARNHGSEGAREVAELLHASDSVHYALCIARERIAAARTALSDLPPSPARESLLAAAEFILSRRQ